MQRCAVVADNESKVRFALRTLLVQRAQMDIVGEAACAEELLDLIEADCPDLVLLHWRLHGMPACELLPRLKEICPDLHVIVLSARPEARQDALASGADAFVSKMDQPEKLLEALGLVQQAPPPGRAQDGGVVAEDRRPAVPAGVAPRPPQPGVPIAEMAATGAAEWDGRYRSFAAKALRARPEPGRDSEDAMAVDEAGALAPGAQDKRGG